MLQPVDGDELEAWEDRALVRIIGMTADVVIPHIQMTGTSVPMGHFEGDRQYRKDLDPSILASQSRSETRQQCA